MNRLCKLAANSFLAVAALVCFITALGVVASTALADLLVAVWQAIRGKHLPINVEPRHRGALNLKT